MTELQNGTRIQAVDGKIVEGDDGTGPLVTFVDLGQFGYPVTATMTSPLMKREGPGASYPDDDSRVPESETESYYIRRPVLPSNIEQYQRGNEEPPRKRKLEMNTSGQQKCPKRAKPWSGSNPCNQQEVASHPVANSEHQLPSMRIYEEASDDLVYKIGPFRCGDIAMVKELNTEVLIRKINISTETAVTSVIRDGELVDISITLPLSKMECSLAKPKRKIKIEGEDLTDGADEATTAHFQNANFRVMGDAEQAGTSSTADNIPECSRDDPVQSRMGVFPSKWDNGPPPGLVNSSSVTRPSSYHAANVQASQSEEVIVNRCTGTNTSRLDGHIESSEIETDAVSKESNIDYDDFKSSRENLSIPRAKQNCTTAENRNGNLTSAAEDCQKEGKGSASAAQMALDNGPKDMDQKASLKLIKGVESKRFANILGHRVSYTLYDDEVYISCDIFRVAGISIKSGYRKIDNMISREYTGDKTMFLVQWKKRAWILKEALMIVLCKHHYNKSRKRLVFHGVHKLKPQMFTKNQCDDDPGLVETPSTSTEEHLGNNESCLNDSMNSGSDSSDTQCPDIKHAFVTLFQTQVPTYLKENKIYVEVGEIFKHVGFHRHVKKHRWKFIDKCLWKHGVDVGSAFDNQRCHISCKALQVLLRHCRAGRCRDKKKILLKELENQLYKLSLVGLERKGKVSRNVKSSLNDPKMRKRAGRSSKTKFDKR